MRIISGCRRGKKLYAPEGASTRPTADRVKESLFNILARYLDYNGLKVLDICAGSGSLGLEALSRGAVSCSFIESDRRAVSALEKNIAAAAFSAKSTVVVGDALNCLKRIEAADSSFDLVFFDPPYDAEDLYIHVINKIGQSALLHQGGVMVSECRSSNLLNAVYGKLERVDRRVYGESAIDIFSMGGE